MSRHVTISLFINKLLSVGRLQPCMVQMDANDAQCGREPLKRVPGESSLVKRFGQGTELQQLLVVTLHVLLTLFAIGCNTTQLVVDLVSCIFLRLELVPDLSELLLLSV